MSIKVPIILFLAFTACVYVYKKDFMHSISEPLEYNGITYQCSESTPELWLCFEEYEMFLGFTDYRLSFEYNPKTNQVSNIVHRSGDKIQ